MFYGLQSKQGALLVIYSGKILCVLLYHYGHSTGSFKLILIELKCGGLFYVVSTFGHQNTWHP